MSMRTRLVAELEVPVAAAGTREDGASAQGGASARPGAGRVVLGRTLGAGAIACACLWIGWSGWSGARTEALGISHAHAWSHPDAPRARIDSELDTVGAATGLGQSRVVPWPLPTVWPTAVRYLRVDRGYAIVDKDPEAGFILFEFPIESPSCGSCEDRKGSGSIELFATTDASGRPSSHIEVTTEGGVVYLPHAILDGLQAKLRDERGPPPPPPTKPKTPPGKPGQPPAPDAPDGPKGPKAPPPREDDSPPQMPLDR